MSSVRILIVEDEEFLRELYCDALSSQGYQVDTALNGEEGLEKVKKGGYDLILSDIIMPRMDGLSMMRQAKEAGSEKPNKSVIFLTNLDKDEEIKETQQLGNGYIIKSQITPGELIQTVQKCLAQQQEPAQAGSS